MRVKERESWIANNVGKGGKKPSYSAFNKEFKGKERNPSASEFASQNMKEYHHYSETVDLTKKEYKKQDSSSSNQSNKSNTSKVKNTNSFVKNIASKVVFVASGAVVVATGYNGIVAEEQAKIDHTLAISTNWEWNEDNSDVMLQVTFKDGTVKEIPATITVTTVDPTCNEDGSITYNATAKDGLTSYTDSRVETIDSHGHHLDDGKVIGTENGQLIVEFECNDCHEKFTVATSINEND